MTRLAALIGRLRRKPPVPGQLAALVSQRAAERDRRLTEEIYAILDEQGDWDG